MGKKHISFDLKQLDSKKVIKFAIIAAVILALLAAGYVAYGIFSEQKVAQTREDMNTYKEAAEKLLKSDSDFRRNEWGDSSAALEDFVTAMNNYLPTELYTTYIQGKSFATTTSPDPWGQPYYITAKSLDPQSEESTYSFYMTSGGKNGTFDTKNFVIDEDDISSCVLKGVSYGVSAVPPETTDEPLPDGETLPDGSAGEGTEDEDNVGADDVIGDLSTEDAEKSTESESGDEKVVSLPKSVTIRLNSQNGVATTILSKTKNGSPMPDISVPVRSNFTFKGYFTSPNGVGTQYYDEKGASCRNADFATNTTLFAYWVGNSFTITLNNMGASVSGSHSVTATYDSKLPSITVPTKEGCAFAGYFTEKNGEGTQYYYEDGTSPIKSNITKDGIVLYAHWSATAYTVEHYVMNTDGTYPITPTVIQNKSDAGISKSVSMETLKDPSLLVDNGIAYSKAEVDGKVVTSAYITDSNVKIKLYYERCKYNLVLRTGKGVTAVTGNGSYCYGATVPIDADLAGGYEWSKWKDETNGTSYTAQTYRYTIPANKTTQTIELVAEGKPKTFTVVFDANGGSSSSTTSKTVTFGETYGTLPTATYQGYTFNGWFTSKTEGVQIKASTKFSNTEDTTLYAQWSVATVTITLDDQGGSGGSGTAKATYNAAMPAVSVPSRKGYTFDGYYTGVDGGGVQYYTANGTSARISALYTSTKLYAKWIPATYTISYRDVGNSVFKGTHTAGYPTEHSYGTTTVLDTPTRAGYSFAGYYLTSDASGSAVTTLGATSISANVVLYAKWSTGTYTVNFNTQGGEGGATSATLTYGSIPQTISIPTRVNYKFAGYFTETGGNGTQYYSSTGAGSTPCMLTGNTTLYAHWTAAEYPITYKDKDNLAFSGTFVTTQPTKHYYGSSTTLVDPMKAGYIFEGWFLTPACSGVAITALGATDFEEAVTLYAKWTVAEALITFDKASGTGGTNSVTATTNEPMPTVDIPTRSGYDFAGYYKGAVQYYTSSGTSAKDCDLVGATTLTAKWKGKDYTITYCDVGGDPCSCDSYSATRYTTYNYESDLQLPNAVKNGFEFLGWYIDSEGNTKIENGVLKAKSYIADITVYAKWSATT